MGLLGTLGSLNVLLSADTVQFSTAMDKAAYLAERDLQRISLKAKLTSTILITAFTAAATSVAVAIKKTVDHADELGKIASSLGLTVEQLSSLEYAAKRSNLTIDDLRVSFQKFNREAFNETNGILANGISDFKALGISLKDNNGNLKSSYELFLEVADALSKMSDGIQKTAAAQLLFGKNGAKMVPFLNEGADGIRKLADEAQALGIVLDTNLAQSSGAFNDNMVHIAGITQGLLNSFASGLIPTLANLTSEIEGSTTALENFNKAGHGVATTIVTLTNGVMGLYEGFIAVTGAAGAGMAQIELFSQFKFKEGMEAGRAYFAEETKRWNDYANNVAKNLAAISDHVEKGNSSIIQGTEGSSEALEGFSKKMVEGESLTNSLRTAQEKYNDELAKYKDLLDSGAINQETYARAVKKAKDELDQSWQKNKQLKDAAKDLGFTFQSAFEDAIIEGKKFEDVLTGLLQDIERIIIRQTITAPLGDAVSSIISSIFKSSQGNVFSGNRLIPFLNGGLITRPSIFPMANGGVGLAGENGTEAIMPLFRTESGDLGVKSGGSGGVEINIYAPEGSTAKTNQQKVGDKDQINIMIDEAVAGSVSSPGSKTYKALKKSFGLRQSLTVR